MNINSNLLTHPEDDADMGEDIVELSETEIQKLNEDLSCAADSKRVPNSGVKIRDAASMYLRDIAATVPLNKQAEKEIFEQFVTLRDIINSDSGTPEEKIRYNHLRDILVNSNMKLVAAIAVRNASRGVPIEDLISEGALGLMYAIDKFDPSRGCTLTTSAYYWINLKISLAIYKQSNIMTVPVWVLVKIAQLGRIETELAAEEGTNPQNISPDAIAAVMEIPTQEVVNLREIRDRRKGIVNIDRTNESLQDSEDEAQAIEIQDSNSPTPFEICMRSERRKAIEKIIDMLPKERCREVIKMRYGFVTGEEMSCAEIGRYYQSLGYTTGISRERIRQVLEEAIETLRQPEYLSKLQELL